MDKLGDIEWKLQSSTFPDYVMLPKRELEKMDPADFV